MSAQLTPLKIGVDPPLNQSGSSWQIDGLELVCFVGDDDIDGIDVVPLGFVDGDLEALLGIDDGLDDE